MSRRFSIRHCTGDEAAAQNICRHQAARNHLQMLVLTPHQLGVTVLYGSAGAAGSGAAILIDSAAPIISNCYFASGVVSLPATELSLSECWQGTPIVAGRPLHASLRIPSPRNRKLLDLAPSSLATIANVALRQTN